MRGRLKATGDGALLLELLKSTATDGYRAVAPAGASDWRTAESTGFVIRDSAVGYELSASGPRPHRHQ